MSLRTALLAAGLTLAAAAPASAAIQSPSKFVGTITATQTTTWEEPHHTTGIDCFHRYWVEERGSETWRVKGQPTKVLISQVGTGPNVSMHYGNFNPHADSPFGLKAKVTRQRAWTKREGSDPGECGGIGTVLPAPDNDCGTRSWDGYVSITHENGAITPGVGPSLSLTEDDGFSDCSIELADEVSDELFAEVPSKIPARDLLDTKQGLHILLGKETFTERLDLEFDGVRTSTTTVTWQLRLKRVK
ncbi:MAG TPA: hypothetical protein VIL49_03620 [Capillimicrobium sp.]